MRKNWFVIVLVSILAVVFTAACGGEFDGIAPVEIKVPDGYAYVGSSAYGRLINNVTHYCQHNENGRVYECTNGQIGDEILIPDGYEFAGASAYGRLVNNVTIYCRHIDSGQVHICG